MLSANSYAVAWDSSAEVWNVESRSGYTLFSSADRAVVAAVCARLNRRFRPGRQRRAPRRAARRLLADRAVQGLLPAFLAAGPAPAMG